MTPYFDEAFYLRKNEDVRLAVQSGVFSSAHEHFEKFGAKEGRDPSVYFNTQYYLARNEDVASAVDAGDFGSAYEHFTRFGDAELRGPSAFFNPDYYLLQNRDVAVAVYRGEFKAFQHFMQVGHEELRQASPYFDPSAYVAAHADVQGAWVRGELSIHDQFANYGIAERRDLGNGVDLTFFNRDTAFNSEVFTGDFSGAFGRVAAVAPFVSAFEKPADYSYPEDLVVPEDFVPPEGKGLVLPKGDFEIPQDAAFISAVSLSYDAQTDTLTIGGTGAAEGVSLTLGGDLLLKDGALELPLRTDMVVETVSAASLATAGLTVTAGADSITVTGSAQADTLTGGTAADTLSGGDGDDAIAGGGGNDSLTGGAGADDIAGGAGGDTLSGGDGDDTLAGGDGDDVLQGGAGADTLTGGAGSDRLTGGEGSDVFVLDQTTESGAVTITDFASGDKIGLAVATYSLTGSAGGALDAGDYLEVASAADLTGGSLTDATDAQAIIVLGSSGEVYYNADGAADGGLVRLATISTVGSVDAIAATDFALV